MTLNEFDEYVSKHKGKACMFFKCNHTALVTKRERVICVSNTDNFGFNGVLAQFDVMCSISKDSLLDIYDNDDFLDMHPECLKYKDTRYALNCTSGKKVLSLFWISCLCVPSEEEIRELYKHIKYDNRGI